MKTLRLSILIVAAFIALTAIGGGTAILTGADEFPIEWLRRTPFPDYTIPALILAIVVGGSSLAAFTGVLTRKRSGGELAIIAGIMMVGYIVVETIILAQDPPGPTLIEILYFVLGSFLAGGGYALRKCASVFSGE